MSSQRISGADLHKFVGLLLRLMDECHLSAYRLCLEVNSLEDGPEHDEDMTRLSRSTLNRLLNGKVRSIPLARARSIVEVLQQYAKAWEDNRTLQGLAELLEGEPDNSIMSRVRVELRLRRVPLRRAIDALRAAELLPPDAA